MKVTKETKRKRFLKLIKKFRELPEERFDIRSWVGGKGPTQLPPNFLTKNHCGTTGCVAGWTVAWFPRSWKYNDDVWCPLLKSLGRDRAPVPLCMSEFFGGSESEWANVIFNGSYSREMRCSEDEEVPKHLVLERLTNLYNKLYKK